MAFALCGCPSQTVKSDQTPAEGVVNQASDSIAVAQRVQEIYQAVFKEYNLEDSLRNLDLLEGRGAYENLKEFNHKYCSSEWNELVSQINEIDSLYHEGELGFWEADYWIMAQDWHNLSISNVEVLAVTPTEADVQFKLHNMDQKKPVALRLIKEDDVWKIDDFMDVENDLDWKQSMQEYVKEENERNTK